MRKIKQTTSTSEVERVLRAADDMLTPQEIVRRTGRNTNQVLAALCMLFEYKVVDFVADSKNKRTHWFALDPKYDTRSRVTLERTPESKPRKKRQGRRKEQQ